MFNIHTDAQRDMWPHSPIHAFKVQHVTRRSFSSKCFAVCRVQMLRSTHRAVTTPWPLHCTPCQLLHTLVCGFQEFSACVTFACFRMLACQARPNCISGSFTKLATGPNSIQLKLQSIEEVCRTCTVSLLDSDALSNNSADCCLVRDTPCASATYEGAMQSDWKYIELVALKTAIPEKTCG
jgi:hypothetical protein